MYGPASTETAERYAARLGIRHRPFEGDHVEAPLDARGVEDVQAVVGLGVQAHETRGGIGRLGNFRHVEKTGPRRGVVGGAGLDQHLRRGATRGYAWPSRPRGARRAHWALWTHIPLRPL